MTSAQLWEQVDAFMSESIEKKIRGAKNGAQNNWIKYIPYPILCKSHTIDNLNKLTLMCSAGWKKASA